MLTQFKRAKGKRGNLQLRAASLQPYSWRAVRGREGNPPTPIQFFPIINLNLPITCEVFYLLLPLFLNSLYIRKAIYSKGLPVEPIRETDLPN